MAEGTRFGPTALWVAACFSIATGCVAPGVSPAPVPATPLPQVSPPRALTEREIEAAATLLELEDRREFRTSFLESSVQSDLPVIRSRAVIAAARIGGVAARPLVRRLVSDPDPMVSSAASFAAGLLADTGAVELLELHLSPLRVASEPETAAEAALALGRIGTVDARAILGRYLLTADVLDPPPALVVGAALLGAWRAGERSPEPFTRWLASSDPGVRWRAVYGLTRPSRMGAVRYVLPILQDTDPLVRSFALRGLGRAVVDSSGVATGEVIGAILPLVRDSSYQVRVEAIRTLATYGSEAALAQVAQIARSGRPHERIVAIEGIGRLGTAAGSLMSLVQGIAIDPAEQESIRGAAVVAAARLNPGGVIAFLSGIADDANWRVRAAAASALGGTRRAGLSLLERLVSDPDPRVAAEAVRAAPSVPDSSDVQLIRSVLLGALQAGDPYVRAAALESIVPLLEPSLFPVLLDAFAAALNDPQNDAQLAAIDAIAMLRDRGVPAPERAFFARFARSGDYLVRQRAVQRFGDAALQSWGEALPLESGVTAATYRDLVRRWVAPPDPAAGQPLVSIETGRGTVVVRLFSEAAPLTVANFLTLVRAGYFDGQVWPRVVPDFVVQGGDPRGDTSGGPGYSIRDELNRQRYGLGTVGMALAGPDTGGSQFFVTLSPQPHLDGMYTVFGEVVSGFDALEEILPGDRVERVREVVEDD